MSAPSQYRYDAGAFREVFEHHFGYLAGVQRNSHRFAARHALHDPATGRRWTYAQLWEEAGRLAAGLAAHGVTAGDAVVIALYNGAEFALLWLAAQRLGAHPSPINFRFSSGEIAYVLDDSRPSAFVYDAGLGAVARDALARAAGRPTLVAVVDSSGKDAGGGHAMAFSELQSAAGPPPVTPASTIYEETTRLYTSCTDDDVAVVRIYDDRQADPRDHVAKDGSEIGEVIVRSAKSGYAYVNRPVEQAVRFRDGWLYIGDLATWDADEYVTIVGRKDDMIISGGENVHPTQVESVLEELAGVTAAVVVGLPDERWGELVVAYVVRGDPALDAAACEAHCHGHPMLAGYKRPRAYRFVDQLPMTATGKKIHYQMRDQARRDAATGLFEAP